MKNTIFSIQPSSHSPQSMVMMFSEELSLVRVEAGGGFEDDSDGCLIDCLILFNSRIKLVNDG